MFIEAAQQGPLHGMIWEAVSGIVLSIGGYILLFPIRTFFNSIKTKWDEQSEALGDIKTELIEQRTNCLQTLQKQGDSQIELLKETVKVLNDMHLDQRTLLGRLDK